MRPSVPVLAVPSSYLTARYFGVGATRIEVSSRAISDLQEPELAALIAHEQAHRDCWHVEVNLAVLAGALVSFAYAALRFDVAAALVVLMACWFLLEVLAIWNELQADAAAMDRTSPAVLERVLRKMAAAHPELSHRWIFNLRLRRAAARAAKGS